MELDALIEAGLRKAFMEPGGCLLHVGRDGETGMFATNAVGRRAATKALQEGLIEPVKENEPVKLTSKGREKLTQWLNPKTMLEDFVRALEQRQDLARQTLKSVQAQAEQLDRLRQGLAELRILLGETPPVKSDSAATSQDPFAGELLGLTRVILVRHESRSRADLLLCELWEGLKAARPELTIGRFHDLLRQWHSEGYIALHPWTGPLYQMPRPELALLCGHEIASYVRWSAAAVGVEHSEARSALAAAVSH